MKFSPAILAALLLGAPVVTRAQDPSPPEAPEIPASSVERTPLSIGLMGGYDFDMLFGEVDLASDRELGDDNCGILETGTGSGVPLGIFAEYLLPSGYTLGARFLSSPVSGSLVAPAPGASNYRRNDGSLVEVRSDNRMELKIPLYQLELYGSFQPFDFPLSITAGPRISIAGGATYLLKEELTTPEDLMFRDGRRYREISAGDPGASLLFGVTASARYPVRLSRTIDMLPELAVGTTINSVTKYGTVRLATARLALGLRYTFPTPGAEPPPPVIVEAEPPPVETPAAPPVASITAVGLDRNGAPRPTVLVEVQEKVTAHDVPILPYIFFDENSSQIPARYLNGTSGETSEAIAIYRDLLDIVGQRLRSNPGEKIILRGATSGSSEEAGNRDLGPARARAIRDHLVSSWRIDSSRIAVEGRLVPERPSRSADSNGRQENRRVEIVASEMILAPVTIADTARTITSPGVRFNTQVVAEAGLEAWQIEAMLRNRPMRRLHGESVPGPMIDDQFTPSELAEIVNGRGAAIRGEGEISYILTARDKSGTRVSTDRQTIGVDLQRSTETTLPVGSTDAPAAIALFDYNSAELRPATRNMLAQLRSRLPAGASLALVGFADETGDAEYNRKLSLNRARAVAAALAGIQTELVGAGESELPYDNNAPEGRFYSRSVRIRILTAPSLP